MYKKFFLLMVVLAALVSVSSAQSPNFQNQTAINIGNTPNVVEPVTRPRIVGNKASAVDASVIVNIGRAERTAFDMINQKRAENGLKPLAWNDDVAAIARLHSRNMAQLNFFGHRGRDNKMVSDRADDEGLNKWHAIGENIAFNRGYSDPIAKAVELWMNSPSHLHNLMDDNWKESAVGVSIGADGSYYFTQVFLKR